MRTRRRKCTGFSTTVLFVMIAIFVIVPLGLMAFEIGRLVLAQGQLQNVTEAAALAGTADVASEPPVSQSIRQQNAMNVAVSTFCANTVMSEKFGVTGGAPNLIINFNSNGSSGPPPPPKIGPKQVWLYIALKDNNGNYVATGSTAASIQISAFYGYKTIFASAILPLWGTYIISAISSGGLPQLDLVLCFDLSGSMDDSTNVYYVRRYWDATNRAVAYQTCNAAPNTIFNLESLTSFPNPNGLSSPALPYGSPGGTPLNVAPPQKLSWGKYYTYIFSEDTQISALNSLRANHSAGPSGSGGYAEQGLPPGNYNPSNPGDHTYKPAGRNSAFPNSDTLGASGAYTNYFTDLIDAGIVGQTHNGLTFDSIATAVEAARGNLDSAGAFSKAVPGTWKGNSAPGGQWYQAYWDFVQNDQNNGMLPMSYARSAAESFLNTMTLSADCHFSLVCFSDRAGVSATDTYSNAADNDTNNIDPSYPQGGQGIFPLPMIALSTKQDNCQTCINALSGSSGTSGSNGSASAYPPVIPLAGTNIADALSCALNQLQNNSRPKAKQAIVLFTDGVPSLGKVNVGPRAGSTFTQPPFYGADTLAKDAHQASIPIYTIGLSQNSSIVPIQSYVLGDGNNDTYSYGIAALSSGGQYWQVQAGNPQALTQAFQSIVRALCVLN